MEWDKQKSELVSKISGKPPRKWKIFKIVLMLDMGDCNSIMLSLLLAKPVFMLSLSSLEQVEKFAKLYHERVLHLSWNLAD
jgi:hypothetical protein